MGNLEIREIVANTQLRSFVPAFFFLSHAVFFIHVDRDKFLRPIAIHLATLKTKFQ